MREGNELMNWRPRISLLSLLLLTTLVCVGLAWWIDRTRNAEPLYLHLYEVHRWSEKKEDQSPDAFRSLPLSPHEIVTIAVVPGRRLYVGSPNQYEPTFSIAGILYRNWDDSYSTHLKAEIYSPMDAFDVSFPAVMHRNRLYPLWSDRHAVVLSRSSDPYELLQDPQVLAEIDQKFSDFPYMKGSFEPILLKQPVRHSP